MEACLLSLMTSTDLIAYVGGRVKTRRKFLKMSRKDLSERCGVSASTILRLETKGVATLHVLIKVAIALNSTGTFQDLFKNPVARSLDEYERQIKGG